MESWQNGYCTSLENWRPQGLVGSNPTLSAPVGQFIVYVLQTEQGARRYVGQTSDLAQRLNRHNAGLVQSTRRYRPWKVAYSEKFATRAEAMQREKWLKSGVGREFLNTVLSPEAERLLHPPKADVRKDL